METVQAERNANYSDEIIVLCLDYHTAHHKYKQLCVN